MPRESKEARGRRAVEVMDRLEAHMPQAKIELDYRTPLELLVSVILSAQCTDKRVNLVTPALFARFRSAADYAGAKEDELASYIRTCGLYRSKARNIIAAAKALVARHGGEVPSSREALKRLAGVGHKTAGVVAIHLGGDPSFPVDTHIKRLAWRLGLTRQTHPDKVEQDLRELLPSDRWTKAHQLLIWHGRRTCYARSPACERCVVADLCPKVGVRKAPKKAVKKTAAKATAKRPPRRARPSGASSAS